MSSSNSSVVAGKEPNDLELMQRLLQNTTAEEDDNSCIDSSDEDEVTRRSGVDAPEEIPLATCDGDGGCGKEFPRDQKGSDFMFASLCSTCYTNQHKIITTAPNKVTKTPTSPDEKEVGGGRVIESTANNNEDESESSKVSAAESSDDEASCSECGITIGVVLSNLRDNNLSRFDYVTGGNEVVYVPYINDQDNITKKSRKFWTLLPNTTRLLYGYKHYHAMLNTNKSSRRGWLCHCRLQSTQQDCEASGYVLWEIWETRCIRPRIDGVLINESGEVILIQHVEKWLVKNDLSSDPSQDYDQEWYHK